ncbi:UNVERIFIED_ORG: hypothetical protein J2X79_003721 [Arthrobacter globiformis]|nr:hypothetical protein [Arthrobacter globiformis]
MGYRKSDYNRCIHLVDIENAIGSPRCTPEEIRQWFHLYASRVGIGPGDLVIVGVTNIHNMFSMERANITAKVVPHFGKDGADLALQEIMRDGGLAKRFRTIYCVSGDGGFAEQVGRLGGGGAEVVVVARPVALSKRLQLAAARTILMPGRSDHDAAA